MHGVVWFREDLRTHDNHALYHASHLCTEGVTALYIIDPTMWKLHDVAFCRIEFILRGLISLSTDLAALNIPLKIFEVNNTNEIGQTLLAFMQKISAGALYFNRQYEVNENRRDHEVSSFLNKNKMICSSYDDQTILAPNTVKTLQGTYFKVFTAYKNAWRQTLLSNGPLKILPAPKPQLQQRILSSSIPTVISDFTSNIDPQLWPAGEKIALHRLKKFIQSQLFSYEKERDFPAIDGTSKLSPYLTAGMISPRQCFIAAVTANNNMESGNLGAVTWMTELIWRDFYKHLLVATPRVSMGKAYQLQTEKIPWSYDKALLKAWQQGNTGFPLIDAAMRQLNSTGWMHNRLRMVVAMFLSKNLFLDWRLGEKYFMQHLIDGDLAANNGGWQWSASTGTDAAPYFRVFNPVRQSERFDPEGKFIRLYCPELSRLDNKAIHDPSRRAEGSLSQLHYPRAIVDLEITRKKAIAIFKNL